MDPLTEVRKLWMDFLNTAQALAVVQSYSGRVEVHDGHKTLRIIAYVTERETDSPDADVPAVVPAAEVE